jgi:phosphate-selective porin OprO/OprP
MLAFGFSIICASRAFAQDQTLAEKLLEIMRANHQITEAQYKELKKEAEKEKAAQAKAAATQAAQAEASAAQAAQAEAAAAQAAKAAEAAKAAPVPKKGPFDLSASWQNGLRIESEDKSTSIHIGGRIQLDVADAEPNSALRTWAIGQYSPGISGPKIDGFGDQVRRARLAIDGTAWQNIEFISQLEFAPSYSTNLLLNQKSKPRDITTGYAVSFQDLWVGVKDIPYIGRFKVGQMYEPISIEQLTSDNFTTFMEKALPVNALIPARNLGFQVQNAVCDERVGWMVGYFFAQQTGTSYNGIATDATADLFSPHLDSTDVAARLYALPIYEDNGAKLLHIGIGYEHKFRSDSTSTMNPGLIDFKSVPEANLFGVLADTGYFMAKGVDVIDPELALVYGPFSAQAEYIWAFANSVAPGPSFKLNSGATTNNASFSGWYAQASYFLTGEHRMYNKVPSPSDYQAAFTRVIPNSNFNPKSPLSGMGAWEIAFRVSNLNLNDSSAGFSGGNETDYTAGINWYLNPNVMLKMNYVYATVGAHAAEQLINDATPLLHQGNDNIFEARFQIAF